MATNLAWEGELVLEEFGAESGAPGGPQSDSNRTSGARSHSRIKSGQPGHAPVSEVGASRIAAFAASAFGGSPEVGPGELADVREALLDDEQLRTLFSDIATYADVLEVAVKASPRAHPDPGSRLPELYLKLVQRRVFGAQMRYEFQGKVWLDTLIATPEGLRLVRVELPQ